MNNGLDIKSDRITNEIKQKSQGWNDTRLEKGNFWYFPTI